MASIVSMQLGRLWRGAAW